MNRESLFSGFLIGLGATGYLALGGIPGVKKEVWRRRLELLKKSGCNAIRCSHNPHMPELYDLCDEIG